MLYRAGWPVALNVTVSAVTDADVARSVLPPFWIFHEPTAATPLASVVGVAPVSVPLPAVTANVTDTPDTGRPDASLTTTAGGMFTGKVSRPVCPSPVSSVIAVGDPAAAAVAVKVTAESGAMVAVTD